MLTDIITLMESRPNDSTNRNTRQVVKSASSKPNDSTNRKFNKKYALRSNIEIEKKDEKLNSIGYLTRSQF